MASPIVRLGRNLRLRLGSGNEAVADGAQLDGLAAGLVDGLVSGDGSAIAALAGHRRATRCSRRLRDGLRPGR